MAKIDFNLALQGGEEEFDYRRFEAGSDLKGTVTLFPNEDVDCKHLYLRLLWHTEGRGSRYTATIEEHDLFQGKLQNGMPRSYDFHFVLPNDPWSFAGHYVSIVWKVQVQVDVAWASDPKDEIGFVLRPSTSQNHF